VAGIPAALFAADGPPVATEQDGLDILGRTFGTGIALVILPAARLDPALFDLRSGVLGALVQKFVNSRCRVAFVGEVPTGSRALRNFIGEANRGGALLFVPDLAALASRLAGRA